MQRLFVLFTLTGVCAGAARADDCAKPVAAARAEADKLVQSGSFKPALALLAKAKASCPTLAGAPKLWLLSDMSFAAYKAGDTQRCADLIGEADDDELAKNPKVAKALLHNAELCAPNEGGCDYKLQREEPVCKLRLALEYAERDAYDGFAAPACPIAGFNDAVELEPTGGAKRMCVGMTAYQKKEAKRDDEEPEITCPKFFVVEDRGGKPVRKELKSPGDAWYASSSDCCNVASLRVKKQSVLLSSDGIARDCYGGTAATDFFTILKLKGGSLVVDKELSIGWH